MTKKSKKDDEPGIGHNLSPEVVMALCRDESAEMDKVEADREILNQRANKIRASLREKGIDTDAWKAARTHSKKDEDQRLVYDLSYHITRKALGTEPQSDMFED